MTSSSKAIAACGLAILLCIGWVSFQSTVRDEEDRTWVTHTHLVIETTERILIDITQAETSQRGYLLTGEDKYLRPYIIALSHVHRDLEEFRDLTSDNLRQQDAVRKLEPLIAARIVRLRKRMAIRGRPGSVAAADAVGTGDDGEELMDEIRERTGRMQQTEEQLLILRVEAATAATREVKAIIIFGNAVAISILLVAGFVIHRETGRRNLAEQELKHAQDLKHINERLERSTVELSETNKELESFSYSVAHDLRAPLRQIAGYSNVLLEDHGPRLDAEARRYLDKIEEGAQKMGRLVDDLLSLSKIGRQALSL